MAAPILPESDLGFRKIAHDMQLLNHPEQQQACEDIAHLIESVRRCWTPADYRKVQERLGAHIERVDSAVGKANVRRARAKNQLRRVELMAGGRGSPEAAHLRAELEQIAFDRELNLLLGRQYRMVGDAMAWQLYGFQSLPLFALGMNESQGTSDTKVGASAEAEVVEQVWQERGAFVLRHDFTTCLRVWDLSIFDRNQHGGPEIAEVKRKQHVRGRQSEQGRIVAQLVNRHLCAKRDGRVLLHLPQRPPTSDGPLPTNLSLLLDAVEESWVEGVGFAANQYLAVVSVNLPVFRTRLHEIPSLERLRYTREVPPEIFTPLCRDYISGNSYDRMARPSFDVPYGVYPLPSQAVAFLVTGYLRTYYHLNTAAIADAFEAAGFEVQCLLDGQPGPYAWEVSIRAPFFRLRREHITITVSGLPIGQMLFEGLPVEEEVASMVAHYEAMVARKGVVLPSGIYCNPRSLDALSTYTSMEAVWRASRGYLTEPDA